MLKKRTVINTTTQKYNMQILKQKSASFVPSMGSFGKNQVHTYRGEDALNAKAKKLKNLFVGSASTIYMAKRSIRVSITSGPEYYADVMTKNLTLKAQLTKDALYVANGWFFLTSKNGTKKITVTISLLIKTYL